MHYIIQYILMYVPCSVVCSEVGQALQATVVLCDYHDVENKPRLSYFYGILQLQDSTVPMYYTSRHHTYCVVLNLLCMYVCMRVCVCVCMYVRM